jgi:hypothetical protein
MIPQKSSKVGLKKLGSIFILMNIPIDTNTNNINIAIILFLHDGDI